MVRFPVQLHDHEPLLPEDVTDRAVYEIFYPAGQDRVPVLCHQHHVVLQQETAVAVRVVWVPFLFIVHAFDFSFTSICKYSIIIP